jgi:hypothetical protein
MRLRLICTVRVWDSLPMVDLESEAELVALPHRSEGCTLPAALVWQFIRVGVVCRS